MSAVKQFISSNVDIDCISLHVSSMYTLCYVSYLWVFDIDWMDSTNEDIT